MRENSFNRVFEEENYLISPHPTLSSRRGLLIFVITQSIIFCGYRVLIYQASATGRCSRAYRDVFTRPDKSISYAFSPKFAK